MLGWRAEKSFLKVSEGRAAESPIHIQHCSEATAISYDANKWKTKQFFLWLCPYSIHICIVTIFSFSSNFPLPTELQFLVKQHTRAINRRHSCFKPQLAQENRWDGCSRCQVWTWSTLPQVGKKNPWAWTFAHCNQHRGRVAAVDVGNRLKYETYHYYQVKD